MESAESICGRSVRSPHSLGVVMLLLSLLACFGSSDSQESEEAKGPRPDIVLVTLDTTRADRLGCYGYEKGDTPVLDALCESGRRYARAYSTIPLTIPSHAAMFTGIHPARLGIRDNGDGKLEEDQVTLAEILKDEGYQTAAAVTASGRWAGSRQSAWAVRRCKPKQLVQARRLGAHSK